MRISLCISLVFFLISRALVCENSQTHTSPLNQMAQPAQLPIPSKKAPTHEPTNIKLNNAQDIEQKVIVTQPKKDPTDCTQLHGKEFMECMECQSCENLKKNLMNCNDRLARYYFLQIYLIEDYHEMLQNFTEKEWQAFYESRHPKSREHFPKTLQEQRALLKRLYIDAYFYNGLEYWWSGQSATKTDDLEVLVKDFNTRRMSSYWFDHSTPFTLQNRFSLLKRKLFTKSTHEESK